MATKSKTTSKHKKSKAWFIPVRGSYLPNSWQGWVSYVPYTVYLLFALVFGWHDTNTHAQAILFIIPNWIAATAVMTWLAKIKS